MSRLTVWRRFARGDVVMVLSRWIRVAILLWCMAEVLVFALVVKLAGLAGALLFTLVASLVGWRFLKRAGSSAMVKLRASVQGRIAAPHQFADETLAALGALALLVPGFLSDLVGLALAVPAARDRVALYLRRRGRRGSAPDDPGRPRSPVTIDLAPDEWTPGETRRGPLAER